MHSAVPCYVLLVLNCPFSAVYLSECPGELHVFGGCVAALEQPGSAVHVHQTLVVVVINGGTQDSQVELLGTGVVDVLLRTENKDKRGRNFSNIFHQDLNES